MQNIWLIVAAVALLLGVAWLLVARLLENRRRLLGLESEIGELRKQLSIFNEGAVGIGRRLVDTERLINSLSSEQAKLLRQSADLSYEQASVLAEQGADIDEIIDRCNMPRAEAELVVLISRQLKESERAG